MIDIPPTLTKICTSSEPELSDSMKCPTKDRNTPTQNTASDCWPQTTSGSNTLHSSPGQSFGTKRMTMITITTKCRKRYGAKNVLSFGLKAEYSQCGNIAPKSGNLASMV